MTIIQTKARAIATKVGFDPTIILQIIMAVLQALGVCKPPVPPHTAQQIASGQGILARWFIRRQVKLYLDDPQAFAAFGEDIAQAVFEEAALATMEEFEQMIGEARTYR